MPDNWEDVQQCAIVITTINPPNACVAALAEGCAAADIDFIVIGDEGSPADFCQQGSRYFDVRRQSRMSFKLASLAPLRSYARKNLGYLEAMRSGAKVIVETDDDNLPLDEFWSVRTLNRTGRTVRDAGWTNAYRHFSDGKIWPRGFPLELAASSEVGGDGGVETLACPIQQGLADANPDVDAIYRLLMPLPHYFGKADPLILAGRSWCPLNSQNTSWWSQAFPLLYLPASCSFRMTDIWRGFVAQRLAAANGWHVAFHAATVVQERNPHDLLRDFADEVPGYLHSRSIMAKLEELDLQAGEDRLGEGMRRCYDILIEESLVAAAEGPLLAAWLDDVEGLICDR